MRNVPIEGGRAYGPPANWDREAQGDCLSLSVLTIADDAGPIQFTAWRLGDAELAALMEGGHLFIGDVLPNVHVRRLLVQDEDGKVVGELLGSADGVRPVSLEQHRMDRARALTIAGALRSAIIAAGIELETRVRGGGMVDDWTGADNAGIVERLAEVVRLVAPASDTVHIPLLNLDDVLRSGRRMPAGFSMSAVAPLDQATRSELERRLGVELNQPGIASVTAPPPPEVNLDWTRTKTFDEAAAECMRAADASTFAETVSEDERNGHRSACNLLAMNFRVMASRAAPKGEASATPTAADVLRYLDTFAGQENTAEEVRDFVQRAARFVDQGKARAEWQADPMLGHFVEWLSE